MSEHRRSRSYSPDRQDSHSTSHRHGRHRSRSPHRHVHRDHDSRTKRVTKRDKGSALKPLPFNASPLSKHELPTYRPILALYLDVQKRLDIEDISEDEVRGRWKSFLGKWNRGELAEGWYDPQTFEKAVSAARSPRHETSNSYRPQPLTRAPGAGPNDGAMEDEEHDSEDDEEYGPVAPPASAQYQVRGGGGLSVGPAIPTLQDLRARNEQRSEDTLARRESEIAQVRSDRKYDRRVQREHLDDLTPRAEAGSRERMLEKKRLAADSNRAFASSAHGGGDMDLKEADVMGDEDSIGDLKRMQKNQERKKNERELRREEILRARIAEREERVKGLREKEDKTMDMLKKIAQARFGGVPQSELDQG